MSKDYLSDIISAISTPIGNGAVSIVRVSAEQNLDTFILALLNDSVPPCKPVLRTVHDKKTGEAIDRAFVLFFPAPHSYTGENVLEIHGHGGIVVTQMILDQCLQQGARLADPGEFTLRAYYNQKIDLAQAEAIGDIIHAESEMMVKASIKGIKGVFTRVIEKIKTQLVTIRWQLEAWIHFPEDMIPLQEQETENQINMILRELDHIIRQSSHTALINRGARVVLAGPVNAGKSSLLNCLTQKNRSIVSPIRGTTRDTIEEKFFFDRIPVFLIDTAGLDGNSTDPIERIGIEKSWEEIDKADLILYLIDSSKEDLDYDKSILEKMTSQKKVIVVLSKIDLSNPKTEKNTPIELKNAIQISTVTTQGIDLLKDTITDMLCPQKVFSDILYANTRQVKKIRDASQHLQEAQKNLSLPEICAEELKWATQDLDEIIGTISNEDILNEIFSHLCLGK